MSPILTPEQALRHLRQLSTDVRAALVLAADGRVLAADGAPTDHRGAPGWVVAVTSGRSLSSEDTEPAEVAPGGARAVPAALVVAAGPHALTDLLLHDLRTLLSDLGAEPSRAVQALAPADSPAAAAIFARLGLLGAGNA